MGRFMIAVACALAAWGEDLGRARALYEQTEYKQAVQQLQGAASAEGIALAGQCWYQLGEFKRAVEEFERAAALDPRNSSYQDWLGRAHGRRAETSNPLAAPGHAVKARNAFEKAVELDASNVEALNDLFSYYLEAPGFLGGGLDKAEALAARMKARNLSDYHSAMARLAGKRKQPDVVERELRRAVELAPKSAARLVELAKYLARQGRHSESDQTFARARKAEPASRQVLYAQAETFIETRRNLAGARKLLEDYLQGPLTPDDPPRDEARRLLEKAR
jgi:tetratricopeptide (TPR) repeat protein